MLRYSIRNMLKLGIMFEILLVLDMYIQIYNKIK